MIIAEIGHSKYLLNSIDDAEKIMRILSESKQIGEGYLGEGMDRVVYENPGATVEISIKPEVEVMTYKKFQEEKNKDSLKKSNKK